MRQEHQPLAALRGPFDRVDVDFSLAIHNRTGKYFIGRDLLDTKDLPIGRCYYWGLAAKAPPSGLFGKIVGRLQHHHISAHAIGGAMRILPRRGPTRPLLHLDPFTIPSTILRNIDAILCHDLGPLTHRDLFDATVTRIYRPIYDEIAAVGPHLIFVSKASQAQFEALYPDAKPASVRCIYPHIRAGATTTSPEPVPAVSRPFILTVGSIGSRKNQRTCIEAYARSGLGHRGVDYVICGGKEPGFEQVQALADRTPGVVCLPYVSDAQLSWLYGSALGFALVSRVEGFGMPVAEAIAHGLVPLVTRDSVLQEVAGEGALVADAEDAGEIAQRMIHLVEMREDQRMRRVGQLRGSIARFDIDAVREDWRIAFRDILTWANAR